MGALPNWIPNLPDGTHPLVRKAVEDSYKRIHVLENSIATLAKQMADQKTQVSQNLQQSALATQSFLTTIPGYDLFQSGSSSQLKQSQASVLPVASGSLIYNNATSGKIVWYFTNLVIHWPDGTTTPIPDTTLALPSLSVTGLTPGTSYYFYPFYNIGLSMVQWAQVAGGVGTPPAAYTASSSAAAQIQNSDGHVAISLGGIQAAATSGGGGGGSGGGRYGFGAQ